MITWQCSANQGDTMKRELCGVSIYKKPRISTPDLMLLHFRYNLKTKQKSPYHKIGFKGMVRGRMRHEIIGLKEKS